MTLTREEIAAVYACGVDAVTIVIAQLEARSTTLEEQLGVQAAQMLAQEQVLAALSVRVKEVENHARTTSRTSSKPPSCDGFVRPLRSLRPQSGQKPGGQPGHVGSALHMVDEPDQVIVHSPAVCAACQRSLADVPTQHYERRRGQHPLHMLGHQARQQPAGQGRRGGAVPPQTEDLPEHRLLPGTPLSHRCKGGAVAQ